MLNLRNITLVACGSTNIEGMKAALEASSEQIDWGAVLLVSPEPQLKSIDEWNKFIVYELGDYIQTPFAMLIHPDGYVVHPESWSDMFLDYDFIGAPWPLPTDDYSYRDDKGNIVRVGNSVSIRSQVLMRFPKQLNLEWKSYYGNTHEDGFITCHNRSILEENGCKFAPIEVAKWFSKELDIPENANVNNPFAFHKRSEYEMFE